MRALAPLVASWGKLNPLQKATASMMCLLAVIAIVAAVGFASRPQYSVLFANLSPGDAGAIVEKLKEQKVEYRVTGGGAVVEVPTSNVYELRLQMAGAGLPQGGNIGFEVFDKSSFGMTEFTQKLNYQRALQGELARTIGELAPVSQARVLLAIPEQTLYADKEKECSASVVVKLRPGQQLNSDQVASITHLVSASVEGLKASNVAVVDTGGNLLSEAGSGPMSASGLRLSASQIQMQKQYEGQVARDLQAMLEKVVGPGKAVVRVNARMNFDSTQTDREIYEPATGNTGVLASEEQTEETYKGAPRGMPGAPAIANAIGGANGSMTRNSATGDNYSRTQSSAHYQVSKRVEHVVQAPGKVERLSVAVLVDGNINSTVSNTIRQAVSMAVGLDVARGDQVTVDSLPFDNTMLKSQDKEMEKAASRELYMSIAKWAAAIILGLLFLFFLRSFLSSWKPVEITESYAEPIPLRAAAGEGAFQIRSDEAVGPGANARRIPRQATEIARESPSDAAKLVRSWLSED